MKATDSVKKILNMGKKEKLKILLGVFLSVVSLLFLIVTIRFWHLLTAPRKTYYCLAVFCFFTLITLIYWMLFKYGLHGILETKRIIVIFFFFGLTYLILTPPLAVPDEEHHAFQAERLSNTLLLRNDFLCRIPANAALDTEEMFDWYYLNKLTERPLFAPLNEDEMRPDALGYETIFVKSNEFKDRYKISVFYPALYLPQAIGISIARLFHLNTLLVFYAGRLFNLLFFCVMAFFALKVVPPTFKVCVLLVMFMPQNLYLASSMSYDCIINALSVFLISYILSLWLTDRDVRLRDTVLLALIFAVLAPMKSIYTPMAFLVFLIPVRKYKNYVNYFLRNLSVAGLAFISMHYVPYILWLFSKGSIHLDHDPALSVAPYTLDFIFNYPIRFLLIFFNTVRENGLDYFISMVGGFLSGSGTQADNFSVFLYALILALSVFIDKSDKEITPAINAARRLFTFIIAFGIWSAAFVAMFISYTVAGQNIIGGVQGRYFIPLLLPLLMAFRNGVLQFHIKKETLIPIAFILNIIIFISAVINWVNKSVVFDGIYMEPTHYF